MRVDDNGGGCREETDRISRQAWASERVDGLVLTPRPSFDRSEFPGQRQTLAEIFRNIMLCTFEYTGRHWRTLIIIG